MVHVLHLSPFRDTKWKKKKQSTEKKKLETKTYVQCSDNLIDSKLPSSQSNDKGNIYIITHFKLYRRIWLVTEELRILRSVHRVRRNKKSHESIVIVRSLLLLLYEFVVSDSTILSARLKAKYNISIEL